MCLASGNNYEEEFQANVECLRSTVEDQSSINQNLRERPSHQTTLHSEAELLTDMMAYFAPEHASHLEA